MSRRSLSPQELFDAACAGDRAALARVLSLLERGDTVAREVGRLAYKRSGSGYTVGITGAPGAGKSVEIVIYPDAPHGFHADYRPSYRREAAEDGWTRALAFLKSHGVG